MKLNELIKQAREKKGYTLSKMARLSDVELHTYQRWERGQMPSAENLIKLIDLLDLDINEVKKIFLH